MIYTCSALYFVNALSVATLTILQPYIPSTRSYEIALL